MSNSVPPHRLQPTRLPSPWDSPGKNTGVGCHFLLQCMKVKSESESEVVSDLQQPHGLQPTRLLHPLNFPGKSTGVGCHCLLQQIDGSGHFKRCQRMLSLCEKMMERSENQGERDARKRQGDHSFEKKRWLRVQSLWRDEEG